MAFLWLFWHSILAVPPSTKLFTLLLVTMYQSTSWSLWDILKLLWTSSRNLMHCPDSCRPWAFLSLYDLLPLMKMNLFVSIVFHDNPFSIFRDNPYDVFHDNLNLSTNNMSVIVFLPESECYYPTVTICLLLSFVTICLFSSMTICGELFWRQSLVVLRGNLLSYLELFRRWLFFSHFISWTLLLFKDSTSCNSKLKVSSYLTLTLRGY